MVAGKHVKEARAVRWNENNGTEYYTSEKTLITELTHLQMRIQTQVQFLQFVIRSKYRIMAKMVFSAGNEHT